MNTHIRPYCSEDESEVIALWGVCLADPAPHNDPVTALHMKLKKDPELFLVATVGGTVVGTVMGGFDGHRGWLYSLAVKPEYRRRGVASALVRRLETVLAEFGCLKVNLQIRSSNSEVLAFYEHIGYRIEDRVSMGKQLYDEEEKVNTHLLG